MSDTARLVLLCIVIAALVGCVLTVVLAATASAAQCGCPAPPEPPTIPQPLPALQPGGGYVFLMWVGK